MGMEIGLGNGYSSWRVGSWDSEQQGVMGEEVTGNMRWKCIVGFFDETLDALLLCVGGGRGEWRVEVVGGLGGCAF